MMTCFVAFLRGINVGGRTVKKEMLHKVFASLGFQNVTTFKQSGNVIFESKSANVEEIKAKIEDKLNSELGYNVAVFIRTMPQLKNIIEQNPFKGQEKEGTSYLVTLLPNGSSKIPIAVTSNHSQVNRTNHLSQRYRSLQRNPWRRRRSVT